MSFYINPNCQANEDGGLDRALRQWKVEAVLPPRFQEQVWGRIAAAESKPPVSVGFGWRRLIEAVLPRPGIALSYVAALVVVGVAAGSVAAQIKTNRLEVDLSARYMRSLNPYQAGSIHP